MLSGPVARDACARVHPNTSSCTRVCVGLCYASTSPHMRVNISLLLPVHLLSQFLHATRRVSTRAVGNLYSNGPARARVHFVAPVRHLAHARTQCQNIQGSLPCNSSRNDIRFFPRVACVPIVEGKLSQCVDTCHWVWQTAQRISCAILLHCFASSVSVVFG